jgi:hypothetical protein
MKSGVVATLVACVFASSSAAALVFYTDRASFQADSGTLTLEGLNSFTTGGSMTVQPTGVTITGVGTGAFSLEVDPDFISEGSSSLQTGNWTIDDTMTFAFATPITAFAIDFLGEFEPFDMDLSVGAVVSGNYFSPVEQTTTTNGPLFMGVRDTVGSFSQVVITTNANNALVNFDFIQFAAVPESSAFLCCGVVAVIAVSCCWARRKLLAR